MGVGAGRRHETVGASSQEERGYLAPLSFFRRVLYLVAFLIGCSLISLAGIQLVSLASTWM
jgi:hypothetical protein